MQALYANDNQMNIFFSFRLKLWSVFSKSKWLCYHKYLNVQNLRIHLCYVSERYLVSCGMFSCSPLLLVQLLKTSARVNLNSHKATMSSQLHSSYNLWHVTSKFTSFSDSGCNMILVFKLWLEIYFHSSSVLIL